MAFDREQLKVRLAALAARGVFLGTSSWKYAGWQGLLYDRDRYVWRGRYAGSRFERLCLAEYAEVFPAVCVDAAYYKFPESHALETLAAQVPPEFQFGFKVTGEISLHSFPSLARFGPRAGRANDNFLNAELFVDRFLAPCEMIRANVGLIMFEFTRFRRRTSRAAGSLWRNWTSSLGRFRAAGLTAWRFAIASFCIRNTSPCWRSMAWRTCSTVGPTCPRWASRWR